MSTKSVPKALQLPTVHLNGTPAERLIEQLTEAHAAAAKLLDALSEAAPNGRDYYPQGPEAFEQARKEHEARIDKVVSVRDELMELACEIDLIQAERNAR